MQMHDEQLQVAPVPTCVTVPIELQTNTLNSFVHKAHNSPTRGHCSDNRVNCMTCKATAQR